MFSTKERNYEPWYAVTTFLSPLQSNDLSDAEKKIAREYLKTEAEKLEDFDIATDATMENNNSGQSVPSERLFSVAGRRSDVCR